MKDNADSSTEKPRTAILFVCLGNICRSPLAEGTFRAIAAERGLADTLEIDSAGVGAWHVGAPPDRRSAAIARKFGLDISAQRARQVEAADFARFDLIFGMDRSNVQALRGMAPEAGHERVHLFLDYAMGRAEDVPDPYYGGADGFAAIYRMLHEASDALAEKLSSVRAGSARVSGQASSTI